MSPVTSDPEIKTIRNVVLKTWGAWNSRNAQNGVRYFRNAPSDMFFDYYPLRFDNFDAYMKGTQTYLNSLSVQGIKEHDLQVAKFDDAALAVGTYAVDSQSKAGEKFHVTGGRYTGILAKQSEGWLLCHEHWSPPATAIDETLSSKVLSGGGNIIKSMTSRDSENESVAIIMGSYWDAWRSLNMERINRHFRKASEDRYFHLYSQGSHNWDDYDLHIREFIGEHTSLSVMLTDVRVFYEGPLAYIASCYELGETLKTGTEVLREGRHTCVLLPSAGAWQIIHEHWSMPVRAAGWENY